MKTVKFQPDAENEMIEAAAYYATQQAQLGRRFLASVQDAINRIVFNPSLYPAIDLDVRIKFEGAIYHVTRRGVAWNAGICMF